MQPALELKNIRKTFGSTVAVEGMDLVVPRGALYGVIGPNGAGKTTCIRMIMSILFPDSGELSVLGRALGARGEGSHRLPAGGARRLPQDEGRRVPDLHGAAEGAEPPRTRRHACRACSQRDRAAGHRRQTLRGSVEGDAPARAVRRGGHPSAGPADPRRAVQRPGSGERPHAARSDPARSIAAAPRCCSRRTSWRTPKRCASTS